MAVDQFLKLDGIKGESVVKGYEDQIDILSWSWGLNQSGTTHLGTGSGSGKASVNDLVITHYVDAASPNLVSACFSGKHIAKATLTMRKAGGTALEYVVFDLEKLMITNVSHGGNSGEDRPVETFSLNFAKVKLSYQPQDDKGAKKGGQISAGFDIAANSVS